MKPTYTELPKGIKISKDLKDFREFAFTEFLILGCDPKSGSDFEKVFQSFCKSQALAQADKLKIAAERI